MKAIRSFLLSCCGVACVVFGATLAASGQSGWFDARRETIEVRLIAVAAAYPRSSFFANDEVFIAEQQLAKDESRFIKLVYDFLPYQSPLSSFGLDYSLLYTVNAVRDTGCDETLWEMRSALEQQHQQPEQQPSNWRYALESPIVDLDRRQARLRCYRTTSDDYGKALHRPSDEVSY